ncbi:hypothetical protein [Nocardia goodfellowii]|uniref:Uncharacterized protein n=1 Tax=Nocardia goodfellowii TaxID=882446 RepID=A0ABS4QD20_9NOCA|nr:hypothetical protein [Nocardia goodfellowii]MBP2189587.1 hypothetical protein [Nocardia goodfellowii]
MDVHPMLGLAAMKLLRGDISVGSPTWSSRGFWLRCHLYNKRRHMPPLAKDAIFGPVLLPEYGGWAIRPGRGWRRIRWVTPPLHWTHAIPTADEEAAVRWMLERMNK